MNTKDFLKKVAAKVSGEKDESKFLFRIKTVPTIEKFSNIGFEGLQELCDMYRKVAKDCDADGEEKLAAQGRVDANRCEELYDKWNGMSTLKVDTETIVKECTDLLAQLYPGYVLMAGQGANGEGMFFDFRLGPLLEEMMNETDTVEAEDDTPCDCALCVAERERHAAGIPKDQLN